MKERIISALTELSHTRGFYNVTMDELAAHAGMSKRTIYRYFSSKEEIIEAVLDKFMANMAEGIEHIIAEGKNPAGIFKDFIKHFTCTFQTFINPMVLRDLRLHYPYLWEKIERFREEKIQNFTKLLINKKEYKREIDPRIFTTAFIASIQAVINPEFILDNELTVEETAKQLVGLFMYGFIEDKC